MRAMRAARLTLLLTLALAACTAPATSIDGLWYGDDGRTVSIANGEVRLDSGELVAHVELVDAAALRYTPAGAEPPRTLQVAFPTSLRMTWLELDGTAFRELTRVAGPE